ncbi:MAG: AEC family transporter, partial [Pseudomonadota bacterium]|nr:AEC family transporter [Pseudomonadota bacterium]
MSIVLDIVLPVFGILLLGYGAARSGVIDDAAVRGLSLFAFTFAIPCLLFRSMVQAELPPALPWGFLGAYYLGAFASFALGMAAGGLLFGRRLDEQGVIGFVASFSNTGLLG